MLRGATHCFMIQQLHGDKMLLDLGEKRLVRCWARKLEIAASRRRFVMVQLSPIASPAREARRAAEEQ